MAEVVSRDLRNDTAGLLRRVEAGEDITITVKGRRVAVLSAARPQRPANALPAFLVDCGHPGATRVDITFAGSSRTVASERT